MNVYGGYFGEGEYKKSENGKMTWHYTTWFNLLRRVNDKNEQNKSRNATYSECIICDDWYNFQNFARWLDENYYEVNGEKMCLDKDILVKNNKTYSPETCIFVPNRINILFTKRQNDRGNCPIGVHYHKKNNCYTAQVTENGKYVYLGSFTSIEGAFNAYKIEKERFIKQVADEYKDLIPQKLYDAMYRYEVDIND